MNEGKMFFTGCAMLTLLFIVLPIIGLFFGIISLPFHLSSNTIETEHGVIDRTLNADNAIYNYEWFITQIEDIKAVQEQLAISEAQVENFKITYGDPLNWSFELNTEYARLNAVKQGQQSSIESMIADYNARSNMANRNIFQDGLIPTSLEIGSNFLK